MEARCVAVDVPETLRRDFACIFLHFFPVTALRGRNFHSHFISEETEPQRVPETSHDQPTSPWQSWDSAPGIPGPRTWVVSSVTLCRFPARWEHGEGQGCC